MRKPSAIALAYLLTFLACLLFAFRYFILSGFDLLAGDDGDARLTMAQLEHWVGVFTGTRWYDSPRWFYPINHVLGIQDGYLLSGLTYSAARLFLDQHASLEVGLMLTYAIGFFGIALFLRFTLRLDLGITLLGAALFAVSGNLYRVHVSQHLLVIYYVPLLAWLTLASVMAAPSVARSFALPLASLLFVALWWSTFYIAWYATIFVVFLSLLAVVTASYRIGFAEGAIGASRFLRARAVELGSSLVILLTGGIMFTSLYLPWLRVHGGWPYQTIHERLLAPTDLVVAGPDNWIWGAPFRRDYDAFGFPPVFVALCLIGIGWGLSRVLRRRSPLDPAALYCALAGVSALLLWLCFVRIGEWAPYRLFYQYVPGGSAMRVPVRVNFFLAAIFVPIVMVVLQGFLRGVKSRGLLRYVAFAAVTILLLAEQGTSYPVSSWSRHRDRHLLATISAPPADCKSFFVNWWMSRPWDAALLQYFYAPMSDAMLLSARFNVPTLNGLGTAAPSHWPAPPPTGDPYEDTIRRWVLMHQLTGVCRLVLPFGQWLPYPTRP